MKKTATKTKPKKKKKGKKSGAVKVVYDPNIPLNVEEEIFCQYYVLNAETRRNAFRSYLKATGKEEELEKAPQDDAIYENDDVMDEEGENDVKKPLGRGKCIQASTFDRMNSTLRSEASRFVAKPNIQKRIYELLNSLLKDEIVDAELVKVISQDEELSPKVRAIEEYNKLRQRTTKTTVEHEFGNINPDVPDHLLQEAIAQGEAFFKKKKIVR